MFETEQQRLENAAAQLEAERARLSRSDGTRLFSDDEHARRDGALLATFSATAEAQIAAVDQAVTAAERTLDALDNPPDPIDTLATDELTKASAKAGFIKEDAGRLDLGPLAARLQRVAASGDKVDRALWLRYGQQRATDLITTGAGRHQPQAVQEAQAALQALGATFADPKAPEKRQAARVTLQTAREARHAMSVRRRQVDGTQARLMAEMRGSGRYSL